MQPIRIAAAVICNARNQVLLVRKRGSSIFIQPGGKIEPGEDPLRALERELHEELGVRLVAGSATWLGAFEERAVHEPGRTVQAQAYLCSVSGVPMPHAEIEELAWVHAGGPHRVAVAPLSAGHILPAFAAYLRCAAGTAWTGAS